MLVGVRYLVYYVGHQGFFFVSSGVRSGKTFGSGESSFDELVVGRGRVACLDVCPSYTGVSCCDVGYSGVGGDQVVVIQGDVKWISGKWDNFVV